MILHAPAAASFGAVSFFPRFGSLLNPQFIELGFASFDGLAETFLGALRALPHGPLGHFHLCVLDVPEKRVAHRCPGNTPLTLLGEGGRLTSNFRLEMT